MRNFFWILITFIFSPIFYLKIFLNRRRKKQSRILVIDTAKIGDLVCATPVFREIKKKFPKSHLTIAIREQSYGTVQNNPRIDKFIFLNLKKYKGFLGRLRLIREISKDRFGWSVNLSPFTFNTILPFWAGIPRRITSFSKHTGKAHKILSMFSDYKLEYKQHTVKLEHNLKLLKFLGITEYSKKKEVFITEEEKSKTDKFFKDNNLQEKDFVIGISVSAGNKIKEYPFEKFAELADKLIDELGAKIIFIGASFDMSIIKKTVSKTKNNVIINTDFKLNELAALLKKIKIFISVDTGPLYIAHAVGTPVVDIIGPCDIDEQPPKDTKSELVYKNIDCWPCSFVIPPARACKKGNPRCIKEITVNEVFVAVKKIIKRNIKS